MPLDEELLAQIEQAPFFKNFTVEEKKELCKSRNHFITYKKGEVIIRQNDFDFSLFIITSGTVVLTKNENPKFKITALNRGDIFGEVSFLKPRSRATNAVAETYVDVMKLDGELLEKLGSSALGKIKDKVIEVLIRRLDDINTALITYAR